LLANAPKGARSASGKLGTLPDGVDPRSLFLRPVVTAVPVDPGMADPTKPADPKQPDPKQPPDTPPDTPSAGTGPARAIFPASASLVGQPNLQSPFTWWHLPAPPAGMQTQAISWNGPSPKLLRAAWSVNQVVRSDNDVLFDSAWPGRHLGARLQEGDTVRLELRIPKTAFAGGKRHFIAHLGFLGGPGAQNTVKARLICEWLTSTEAAVPGTTKVFVPAPAGKVLEAAAGNPMQLFDQEFDAAGLPAAADHLRVRVYLTGGPFDPAHPPALFGVRLVP
jgi:hypothetical protein